MKTLLLVAVLLLTGCASEKAKQDAMDAHHKAQAAYVKTLADSQHPIFEMVGLPGQSIELRGVQSLKVYSGDANKAAQFQPAPVPQNELVQILNVTKDLALGLGPYWLGGKVINGIRDVSAAGRGASNVTTTTSTDSHPVTTTSTTSSANQANQANISNANQANQANVSNANQANPTTTTTTQTLGNNSVLGSGSSSNPSTTTNTPVTTNTTTTNSQHGTCTTGSC